MVLLAFLGLSEGKVVDILGLSVGKVVVVMTPKVGYTFVPKKSLELKDGGMNFWPNPNSLLSLKKLSKKEVAVGDVELLS